MIYGIDCLNLAGACKDRNSNLLLYNILSKQQANNFREFIYLMTKNTTKHTKNKDDHPLTIIYECKNINTGK